MLKMMRKVLLSMLAFMLMVTNVQAYGSNINLSVSSVSESIDSGERANFIVDFKTTGATKVMENVELEIEIPEEFELVTSFDDLSFVGQVPEKKGNLLVYKFDTLRTGVSQRNVISLQTRNGHHLNGDEVVVKTRTKVDGNVIDESEAITAIKASGGVSTAKTIADVDGKGAYENAKSGSIVTWKLRVSSNKKDSAQLYVKEGTKIIAVDKLPKDLIYVSDDSNGKYDKDTHTIMWEFNAPTIDEQDSRDEYLFLETIEVKTKVRDLGKEYYEKIGNTFEAELELIDGNKVSSRTQASLVAAAGGTEVPPEAGSYYRGNHRGPSDGNNGLAPSREPNPTPSVYQHGKLRFAHGVYVHPGVMTDVYIDGKHYSDNGVMPSGELYKVVKNGYKWIKTLYLPSEGLLLDKIYFGGPRYWFTSEVPYENVPTNELPVGEVTVATTDGRVKKATVDYRKYPNQRTTIEVSDLFDEEFVEVEYILYELKSPKGEVMDGRMSFATILQTYYRIKPGFTGKVEESVVTEYEPGHKKVVYTYDGRKRDDSPMGRRGALVIPYPKGTLPIAETKINLKDHYGGVIMPGENTLNVELRNTDGSLDSISPNYEIFVKVPSGFELDLDLENIDVLTKHNLKSAEQVAADDDYKVYKFTLDGSTVGLAPSESLKLEVPVVIDPKGNANVDMAVYAHSTNKDLLAPEYSTDLPTNTIIASKDDELVVEGILNGDLTYAKSENKYDLVKREVVITRKLVKGELDDEFSEFGHTTLDGDVDFKLELEHTQSSAINEMTIIDVLPNVNDLGITDNEERGSKFELTLTGPLKLTGKHSEYFEVAYSTEENPSRADLNNIGTNNLADPEGAVKAKWVAESEVKDWSQINSFKIKLKDGKSWKSSDKISIDFTMKAPKEPEHEFVLESKDDITKYEKAAWNSFAVAMSNLQVVEPSRVGVAIIDELIPTAPEIDKKVNDEKDIKVEVDEVFSYSIDVNLPESVYEYKNMTIEDVIDERLEVKGITLNGKALDIDKVLDERLLRIELTRDEILEAHKESGVVSVGITAKIDNVTLDENNKPELIKNTAHVDVNNELRVDVEKPSIVRPDVPMGELTAAVIIGENKIHEVDQIDGERLLGSTVKVTSHDDNPYKMTDVIETKEADRIIELPAGKYVVEQITEVDGYIITEESLVVEVHNGELTVVEIWNPKKLTPPKISAEKLVNKEEVTAGDTVEYTIAITNEGEQSKVVTVKDDFADMDVEFIGDVHVGDETYTFDELTKGVNIEIPGESVVNVVFEVKFKENASGEYVNTANVDDLTPSVPVEVEPLVPVIKAEKLVDKDEIIAGETLEYTIKIWNEGNTPKVVTVKDEFEGMPKFTGGDVIVGDETYTIEELKSGIEVEVKDGETVEVVFEIVVDKDDKGGEYINVANVDDLTPDVPVKVVPRKPIIKAEKLANKEEILAGETVEYTIKVWNEGNKSKVVTIKDTFDGMPEVHGDKVYVGEDEYTLNELIEGIEIEVRPEEVIEVIFEVKVDESAEGGLYTNTANVDGLTPNVPVQVTPLVPIIKSEKIANKEHIKAGETVTYTINIWNEGNTDKDVFVKDTLENIPAVGGSVNVGEKTYTIEELQSGIVVNVKPEETVSVTFDVVFDKYAKGGQYTNVANVDDMTPSVPVEVEPLEPSINAEKSIDKDVIKAGETVTYTIKVWNEGEIEKVVTIKDDMKFISDVSEVITDTITIKGNEYTIEQLKSGIEVEVNAGEEIEFSFDVQFNKEAHGEFTNVVEVDELTPGVPVEVEPNNPIIKTEKLASASEVKPGETVEYTIRIWNEGNASKLVNVKDPMTNLIDDIEMIGEYVMVGDIPYTFSELMNGIDVEVKPGEIVEVTFEVEFTEDAEGEYINIAYVDEFEPEVPVTVVPEEPVTPEEPEDGDDGETPDEPGTDEPETPEEPENPEDNEDDKPTEPEEPTTPEGPEVEEPETPEEPGIEVPETPENPEIPEVEEPTTPEEPEAPEVEEPETPETPETPEVDGPVIPETPEVDEPTVPTPETPEVEVPSVEESESDVTDSKSDKPVQTSDKQVVLGVSVAFLGLALLRALRKRKDD